MTVQYLISIAIGPVQEFIASARRSRDLWFGSWLLSELSKAAADKIADGNEKRLIFPAVRSLDDLKPATKFPESGGYLSVVNKITAVVETDNVSQFAKDVFNVMKGRLTSLRTDAFERFKTEDYFDRVRAEKQIDDLIEFYCAAVPLPDEESYSTVRRQAEILLTARKNTRDFISAKDWAQEGIPKSSLDGIRESVIKKKADELSEEERRQKFGTRPGERLCGIGLLKRLGNGQNDIGFFSTSHVAAFPLLSNLKKSHSEAVKQYFNKLKGIDQSAWSWVSGNGSSEAHKRIAEIFRRCDGRLLFEDRLGEYFEKKKGSPGEHKKKINNAKAALRDFLKETLGDRKPFPYYALLLADGDGMGNVIETLDVPNKHRNLSSKLSDFAKSVHGIVETTYDGSLIYAGGDDVLAFIPLHQVVQCSVALSDAFNKKLSDGQWNAPTLSIGIAICHHLDPLSDALALAREAEKEAKRLPGKNALCINLDKRSGETTTVVDHWGRLDERLEFFTLLFVADKLPDGVAYEFQKLADQLCEVPEAIPGEVKRILKRKRAGHGEEELDKKVAAKLQKALEDLGEIKGVKNPLARLSKELLVARALAAAQEQSFPDQETAQKYARARLEQTLKDIQVDNGGDNANVADRTA